MSAPSDACRSEARRVIEPDERRHNRVKTLALVGRIGLAFALALAGAPLSSAVAQTAPEPAAMIDQIIVRYRNAGGVGAQGLLDLTTGAVDVVQTFGVQLRYVREAGDGALIVALSQSLTAPTAEQLTTALEASPNVLYAEPDYRDFAYLTPGDSLYAQQWSLAAPAASTFGMNLEAAWDLTTGDPDLVVAVIDTGILPTHPDLVGRTVPGYDFVTDPINAADSDGHDADPTDPGDWTVDDECIPGWVGSDSSWHGTHVAGIVGASGDNSAGVSGVNWGSKIQAVRVLGKCGGLSSDIADAIRWAAGVPVPGVPVNPTPARVINLSLGGVRQCSTTYQTAIDAARAAGAVVVAAAGNSTTDAVFATPANCVGVIAVGATDRSGNLASYSNYGTTLDLAAPGGDMTFWGDPDGVLSTYNDGATDAGTMSYDYLQGTSMAAPQVAGVLSLILSANPFLNPDAATAVLIGTLTPLPVDSQCLSGCGQFLPPPCTTSTCGPGIPNAAAAVTLAQSFDEYVYLPALALEGAAAASASLGASASLDR